VSTAGTISKAVLDSLLGSLGAIFSWLRHWLDRPMIVPIQQWTQSSREADAIGFTGKGGPAIDVMFFPRASSKANGLDFERHYWLKGSPVHLLPFRDSMRPEDHAGENGNTSTMRGILPAARSRRATSAIMPCTKAPTLPIKSWTKELIPITTSLSSIAEL